MVKFIFKLAFVIIGVYIIFQIPFFREYGDKLRASIMEKADNVRAEVDRVKGTVDAAKQRVNETTQAIQDVTNTVKNTANEVESGITKAKTAIDSVSNAFKDEGRDKTTEQQNLAIPKTETK